MEMNEINKLKSSESNTTLPISDNTNNKNKKTFYKNKSSNIKEKDIDTSIYYGNSQLHNKRKYYIMYIYFCNKFYLISEMILIRCLESFIVRGYKRLFKKLFPQKMIKN